MKLSIRILSLSGVAAALLFTSNLASAQQRGGNFDPEQMRQRMMENYRERLEVKDNAEWNLIEQRISKVLEARRDVGVGGFGGRGGFGGPPRGRGDANAERGGRGGRGGGGGGFFGAPLPEVEELQAAIENKASSDEIKAKLAKVREARKAKREVLAKAQDELRKVLSVRQEATAVVMGLLD